MASEEASLAKRAKTSHGEFTMATDLTVVVDESKEVHEVNQKTQDGSGGTRAGGEQDQCSVEIGRVWSIWLSEIGGVPKEGKGCEEMELPKGAYVGPVDLGVGEKTSDEEGEERMPELESSHLENREVEGLMEPEDSEQAEEE
eukprot:12429297-Karenia_brevis.AAC.1